MKRNDKLFWPKYYFYNFLTKLMFVFDFSSLNLYLLICILKTAVLMQKITAM